MTEQFKVETEVKTVDEKEIQAWIELQEKRLEKKENPGFLKGLLAGGGISEDNIDSEVRDEAKWYRQLADYFSPGNSEQGKKKLGALMVAIRKLDAEGVQGGHQEAVRRQVDQAFMRSRHGRLVVDKPRRFLSIPEKSTEKEREEEIEGEEQEESSTQHRYPFYVLPSLSQAFKTFLRELNKRKMFYNFARLSLQTKNKWQSHPKALKFCRSELRKTTELLRIFEHTTERRRSDFVFRKKEDACDSLATLARRFTNMNDRTYDHTKMLGFLDAVDKTFNRLHTYCGLSLQETEAAKILWCVYQATSWMTHGWRLHLLSDVEHKMQLGVFKDALFSDGSRSSENDGLLAAHKKPDLVKAAEQLVQVVADDRVQPAEGAVQNSASQCYAVLRAKIASIHAATECAKQAKKAAKLEKQKKEKAEREIKWTEERRKDFVSELRNVPVPILDKQFTQSLVTVEVGHIVKLERDPVSYYQHLANAYHYLWENSTDVSEEKRAALAELRDKALAELCKQKGYEVATMKSIRKGFEWIYTAKVGVAEEEEEKVEGEEKGQVFERP